MSVIVKSMCIGLEEGFKNNFDNNLTALETDLDAFSADPIVD